MYSKTQISELLSRWEQIRKELKKQDSDALLLCSSPNLLYVAERVFNGYFYLPAEGEPIFFVKRPLGLTQGNVAYIRKPEDIPAILAAKGLSLPARLALEADVLSYSEAKRLENILQPEQIENASQWMRQVRAVKTPAEIENYRQTARIHAEAMKEVPTLFREGMRDIDFAIEVENLFRRKGSLGIFRAFGNNMEIFMGSLLSGDNAMAASPYDFALGGAGMSPSLPIGCSGEVLSRGKAVMVDFGGSFSAYMSDLSRTYSVGKLPELAYKAHQVSLEIQDVIEHTAKAGVPCKDLYELSLCIADKAGLSEYFMGYGQQASFVGHGIGIEINELPILFGRSKDILQSGNVFALEPKFVIPGVGAVGIENSFAVHEGGIEKLTCVEEEIIDLCR